MDLGHRKTRKSSHPNSIMNLFRMIMDSSVDSYDLEGMSVSNTKGENKLWQNIGEPASETTTIVYSWRCHVPVQMLPTDQGTLTINDYIVI